MGVIYEGSKYARAGMSKIEFFTLSAPFNLTELREIIILLLFNIIPLWSVFNHLRSKLPRLP
jgi:hypothetical protein